MSYHSMASSSKMQKDLGLSKRPKIFEQWPRVQRKDNFYQEPSIKGIEKRRESREAEQALQKSLLLLRNLQQYLELKNYNFKMVGEYNKQSNSILSELSNLITQRDVPYNESAFQQQLIKFNKAIRSGSYLQMKLETFQITNLANYNPSHTSILYTRNYQSSHKELVDWIQAFKIKRMRLQQSLVCYEQEMPENRILGEQNNFKFCLKDVKEQMDLDHMADVHMLMLFQLADTKEKANAHTERILSDRRKYNFYQSVHDSMAMMKNQYNEMKEDLKKLKEKQTKLTYENAAQIIPQIQQNFPTFDRNMKIYDSNNLMFARYNAEVSLTEYAERRKKFANRVIKYKKQYNYWQNFKNYATTLFSYHKKLADYQKKQKNQQLVNNLELQKKQIRQIYDKCLSTRIPSEMQVMQKYKFRLAEEIEKQIKQGGIIVPKRQQLPENKNRGFMDDAREQQEELKKYLQNGSILQKYIQFFMNIKYRNENEGIKKRSINKANKEDQKYRPNSEKLLYLFQNQDTAKSLSYQIKQQFKGSKVNRENQEMERYRTGLHYAIEINKCLEEFAKQKQIQENKYLLKKGKQTIEYYFQNVSNNNWKALPIGLQSLLFNFSADLIKKSSALQFFEEYEKQMKEIGKTAKIEEKVWQEKQMKQFDEDLVKNLVKISAQDRSKFYKEYFRKISKYSPQIKADILELYWQINQNMVCETLKPFWSQQNLKKVEKPQFFTGAVLSYLTNSEHGKSIRVPNIDELISYYLSQVDRLEYNNWNQGHIFLEIVKQRLLLKYLQKTMAHFMNTNIRAEIQVIKTIMAFFHLLYQMRDCLYLVGSQNIEPGFKHGLLIQKDMTSFVPTFDQTTRSQLVDKCIKVISNIKKLPFVLGTESKIEDFIDLINFEQKKQNLKMCLNSLERSREKFKARCQIYAQSNSIYQIYHSTFSKVFLSPEVVIIRDRQKKTIRLEAIANNVKKQLNGCGEEIQRILKIYRGHPEEQKSMKESSKRNQNATSQTESLLRQIRESLE